MPKSKVRIFRISTRIRDIGDEPQTLFLIGIAQRPMQSGNARLIDWSTLHRLLDMAGRDGKKLATQAIWALKHDGEYIIENFSIPSADFSNVLVGDILEWLVSLTKKSNQSDGLKSAFRGRTTGMRGPHIRWHEKRGRLKAGCEFCNSPQISN